MEPCKLNRMNSGGSTVINDSHNFQVINGDMIYCTQCGEVGRVNETGESKGDYIPFIKNDLELIIKSLNRYAGETFVDEQESRNALLLSNRIYQMYFTA